MQQRYWQAILNFFTFFWKPRTIKKLELEKDSDYKEENKNMIADGVNTDVKDVRSNT